MDPSALLAVALLVVLAVALVFGSVALRRGRALAMVRSGLDDAGIHGGDVDPAGAIRRLDAEAAQRTASLEAARRDHGALVETTTSGIVRTGADGRVVESNAAADALLARGGASLVGRTLMEVFLDPEVESLVRNVAAGATVATESRPAGPDGPAIVVRARRTGDGGAWLVLEDVSELRRLQRIRAEFIDNLSHELRTPLTTVSLLAETLSRDVAAAGDQVPPRMRERVEKIEVETGHLVQMVNELLDLSRIESGGTLHLVDGVDLGRLASDAAERLRLFAERQGVTLRVEAVPGLPPVRGDAARLGQVVVNLVHNAVKFSPDGGEVAVRAFVDGAEAVVSVEDHGVGIPRAAQGRVFERFYKVDRARLRAGEGGGTGLGLAIARHVVDQHAGRIWVVSTEGIGSTFSFALPLSAVGPETAAGHEPAFAGGDRLDPTDP